MPEPLAADLLNALARYNTPTIANAIELFHIRPRHVGFLPHAIRCLTPSLGPMVGYAVTSQTRAAPPSEPSPTDRTGDYLHYVARMPGPKIAVGQDLDTPTGLGAQFGEVNATIHKKLGCVGHITDGCPRDLDEVTALGFGLFGLNPCVSHAYVRLEGFGETVHLAGVAIRSGELLHADKHGVCLIPLEIAERLPEACEEIERLERPLLEYCRRDDFELDDYIRIRAVMKQKLSR